MTLEVKALRWEIKHALSSNELGQADIVRRSLRRMRDMLDDAERERCRVCNGVGSIPGFWLGSVKTCTSCHGRGVQ